MVTLNIRGNKDTQMYGRSAVSMCVRACVCLMLETQQRQGYSSWLCQDKTERSDTEREMTWYVAKQKLQLTLTLLELFYNTPTDASQTFSLTQRPDVAGRKMYRPSHCYWSVRFFRPVAYNMLQLSRVWDVVARLVLSQDLHQRTQLQPPLLLRDPVTADRRGNISTVVMSFFPSLKM